MPEIITYTDAPAEGYDWYYTTDLGVVGTDESGLPIRKVSSPGCWYPAQRDRYRSGLHFAVGEAEWEKLSAETNPDYPSLRFRCELEEMILDSPLKPGTRVQYSDRFMLNLETLTGEKSDSPIFTVLECHCGCNGSGMVLINRPSDFEGDEFSHVSIGNLKEASP
jgi:hypothetical protein